MSNIFSQAPQRVLAVQAAAAPVPAPVPTPVATIPTVDDETVRQERALNAERNLQRGGRRSTILTSPATRSGGDSYSAARFGG